jgi:acetoin utilization deacetylase AcuC-like enzyme
MFHNTEAMMQHVPPSKDSAAETPFRIVAIEAALKGIPYREACSKGHAILGAPAPESVWTTCTTTKVDHMIAEEDLEVIYGKGILRSLQRRLPKTGSQYENGNGDLYWSPQSLMAARVAVAATVEAMMAALQGSTQTAFCVVRPPGHHCFDLPEGFCVFNNVAIAAEIAVKQGKRVTIVDWDYHFGDGTAKTFLETPEVQFVSFHCRTAKGYPTYPANTRADWKGAGLAKDTQGRMWNVQWESDDADDAAMKYAFEEALLPAIQAFQSDLILISAGFDAVKGDSLAGMKLTTKVFGYMADQLASLGVPTVAVLEGGYDAELLGACCVETVKGLQGRPTPMEWPPLQDHHKQVVDDVVKCLKTWQTL